MNVLSSIPGSQLERWKKISNQNRLELSCQAEQNVFCMEMFQVCVTVIVNNFWNLDFLMICTCILFFWCSIKFFMHWVVHIPFITVVWHSNGFTEWCRHVLQHIQWSALQQHRTRHLPTCIRCTCWNHKGVREWRTSYSWWGALCSLYLNFIITMVAFISFFPVISGYNNL